jgi:hypothetical protein
MGLLWLAVLFGGFLPGVQALASGLTKQTVASNFNTLTGTRVFPGSQRLLVVQQNGKLEILQVSSGTNFPRETYMQLSNIDSGAIRLPLQPAVAPTGAPPPSLLDLALFPGAAGGEKGLLDCIFDNNFNPTSATTGAHPMPAHVIIYFCGCGVAFGALTLAVQCSFHLLLLHFSIAQCTAHLPLQAPGELWRAHQPRAAQQRAGPLDRPGRYHRPGFHLWHRPLRWPALLWPRWPRLRHHRR